MIPVFLYLGIGLHTAMATALLLNALAMFFACLRFVPAGMVDFRAAVPILIVATVLSPLGAWSSAYLPVPLLKGLFVGFLLFAATMMLFYRAKPHEARIAPRKAAGYGAAVGGAAGYIGGLLGGRGEVLEAIRAALRTEHHIEHVTLQPECGSECTLPTATALRHGTDNPNADNEGGSPSP